MRYMKYDRYNYKEQTLKLKMIDRISRTLFFLKILLILEFYCVVVDGTHTKKGNLVI